MVRLLALLAGLVIAVTGCSNAVAGTPVPGPVNNEPLTAGQVFGEFSTVNYCSLITTELLPRELGEVLDPAAASLDYCILAMRMKGAYIEGRVGYLEDSDSIEWTDRTEDRQRTPPQGLKVQRGEESDERCERFLQFTDDVWLTVTADSFKDDEGRGGDWCPLADAMLDVVIERVRTRQVRHFIWDEKSVAGLDACDLVKPDVVAARLGLRNASAQRFLSGHECRWIGPGRDDPYARLIFEVFTADGGTDETIAGRHTRVLSSPAEADDELSVCLLETEHLNSIAFGQNELVDLEVGLPGKDKDPCVLARELAKEIWTNLPKP